MILGILAAVTVFAVRGITDKGQTNACQADSKAIAVAVESYFAQYGTAGGIGVSGPPAAGSQPSNVSWTIGATAIDTLTNAGYFRAKPTTYTVSQDGLTITPVSPGKCAGVPAA